MSTCCKNKLRPRVERVRKLVARDEKRLMRRKAELKILAVELNRANGLPPFCSACDDGD